MSEDQKPDMGLAIAIVAGLITAAIVMSLMGCAAPSRASSSDLYQSVRPCILAHPYPVTY